MPTFRITGPDGRVYNVTGPDGATAEQALARVKAQAKAKTKPKSTWENIKDVGTNAAAGLAQGATAMADIAYKVPMAIADAGSQAADFVVDKGLRAVGAEGAADALTEGRERIGTYRPRPGIGDAIERIAPTQQGQGASRFAYQVAGGFMTPGATRPQPRPQQQPNALMASADRLGVQPMAADVGGPITRRMTSAAAQGPISAQPIVAGAQRVVRQSAQASENISANVGARTTGEAAGEAATRGAQAFRRASRTQAGHLYERAEQLTQGATVRPTNAIAELDRHIAELGQTPGGAPALDDLVNLREEIAGMGDIAPAAIRRMRSVLGRRYLDNGLTATDTQRRVNQVIDAAANDIQDSLVRAGRGDAAQAYRQADRAWRHRMLTMDRVIKPIIGKEGERSGEEVIKALERAASGNGRRLQRFMATMPDDEASVVRATFIDRMGRKTDGLTEQGERLFSLDNFLTRWDTMTPRARAVMFNGETRAALNDLATVARGSRAANAYANRSNTAGGVMGQAVLSGTLGAVGGFPGLLWGSIVQYGAGRLLAAPAFARWLAQGVRINTPQRIPSHIGRLSAIASQNPAISAELNALQRALNDNASMATTAAASEVQDSQ